MLPLFVTLMALYALIGAMVISVFEIHDSKGTPPRSWQLALIAAFWPVALYRAKWD